MKKFVLRLELEDNKEKRKALKTVSSLPGIDEISIDMKGKTLIVIGTVDPVSAASKLRKFWPTTILSVGPAKEPEPPKKEEPKKEEPKKDEPKKEEEPKKDEPKKDEQPPKKEGEDAAAAAAAKTEPPKNEEKKPEPQPQPQPQPMVMPYRPYYHPPPMQQQQAYRPYYPTMQQTYYHMHHSIEENPNACVIS